MTEQHTLAVGDVRLDSPITLAPMSGVSDLPFRRLVKDWGAGLVVSEMIASQAMIRANAKTLKMSTNCAEEHPMAVQLAGCDPAILAEAARLNADRGAAIIDINMGCPVKKVTNGQHAGSALMKHEDHATRIIEATVKAVNLPVTLKMRTGWDDANRNAPRLARLAEDAGVRMITVHGRTRCQFYKGRSDWNFISRVKAAVGIPVVGNGDVVVVEDARDLLRASGADGVMVGRGTYGRPWFLRQIMHFLNCGERLPDPTLAVQRDIVLGHYEHMLTHYGRDPGVRIARKHIGWYVKGMRGAAEFRGAVNRADDPDVVRAMLDRFYEANMAAESA